MSSSKETRKECQETFQFKKWQLCKLMCFIFLEFFLIFAVSLQIILCLVGNFVTVICASEVGNSKISTILLDITWQWKQLALQPPDIVLGPRQAVSPV